MAKLVSREDDVLIYEVLQLWTFRDHEVALMRLTNKAVPESACAYLLCECDFHEGPRVLGGPNDPHACEAKGVVRNVARMDARREHGEAWRKMGMKDAILDIHRRVKAQEFLGQGSGNVIYTQEVSELLGGKPLTACLASDEVHDQVLAACGELYAEERLELAGRILADYVPCFRFPREMQAILRYVVEEPLGWPNGDAGECWLAGYERDVQERIGMTGGKAAFGRHWPSVDLTILAAFALGPVAGALRMMAPLVPEDVAGDAAERMADEAVGDAWQIAAGLKGLEAAHPEIAVSAFREFVRGLLRVSLQRVEMDKAMRTVKVPAAQTLVEMAAYFEKLAAHCREKAAET